MGPLANSPADILAHLLADLDQGVVPMDGVTYANGDWPIYVAGEPSAPDDVVTLYDTTGRQQGRDMVFGQVFEHHGVQVRVRATDHEAAYVKCRELAVKMDTGIYQDGVTVGANRYVVQCVDRQSDCFSLGRNAPTDNRRLFTVNVMVVVRQLAEGEEFPDRNILLEDGNLVIGG